MRIVVWCRWSGGQRAVASHHSFICRKPHGATARQNERSPPCDIMLFPLQPVCSTVLKPLEPLTRSVRRLRMLGARFRGGDVSTYLCVCVRACVCVCVCVYLHLHARKCHVQRASRSSAISPSLFLFLCYFFYQVVSDECVEE